MIIIVINWIITNMKRMILSLAVTGLLIYYLINNFSVVKNIYNVASSITIGFLLLAALLSVIAYSFLVKSGMEVFSLVGVGKSFRSMLKLQLKSAAINVLVPSAGASVLLLYTEEAKKNNESTATAAAAYFVSMLASYSALLIILIFAVVYLSLTGKLTAYVYIPAIFFLLLVAGIFLLFGLSITRTDIVRTFFLVIKRIYAWFMHFFGKKISPESGIDAIVLEIQSARIKIFSNPKLFLRSVGSVLLSHFFYLAAGEILFLSFGYHPLYRILISGYATGALFTVISPTPNGVGFAEVGMAAVFTSLGVDIHLSGVISILLRAFSYWLPLLFGFLLLQQSNLKKITKKISE